MAANTDKVTIFSLILLFIAGLSEAQVQPVTAVYLYDGEQFN